MKYWIALPIIIKWQMSVKLHIPFADTRHTDKWFYVLLVEHFIRGQSFPFHLCRNVLREQREYKRWTWKKLWIPFGCVDRTAGVCGAADNCTHRCTLSVQTRARAFDDFLFIDAKVLSDNDVQLYSTRKPMANDWANQREKSLSMTAC